VAVRADLGMGRPAPPTDQPTRLVLKRYRRLQNMSQGPGRDGAPDSGQRPVLTGRPRKATNRSMGTTLSDDPGRAEATCAGLVGQLGADEGERLLRQLGGLPCGLGEVPAVGEQVVETDLQSFGAAGRPERPVIAAFEDSRLIERGLQRDGGIAVGANGIVFDVVSGRPRRRRLVGEKRGEEPGSSRSGG